MRRLISIVMPAFNEEAGIQLSITEVLRQASSVNYDFEVVVVDDGSRDATYSRAVASAEAGQPVRAVRLSRNFGKEAALLAGLQHARGSAVITIDADLQHPPAVIPEMIRAWEEGATIVHGLKRTRGHESWMSTTRARLVNSVLTRLGGVDVRDSSDFKLLDRAAVDVLTNSLRERRRFYRGLAGWIGFSQRTIEFDVADRLAGSSGWRLRSLVALTLTALVSFSSAPLRIVSVLGVATLLLGLAIGTDALWSWTHGNTVSGFTTIVLTLLLIGSFIMISLGVIGEYIAKMYDEIKQRPVYIVDRMQDFAGPAPRVVVPLPAGSELVREKEQ